MARGLYVVDQIGPIDVTSRAAVNTFTAFQDVYGAPQKIIPKSRLDVGLTLDVEAFGEVSTTGSPTFSLGLWFNGAALVAPTTILAQTQLAAYPVATVTGAPWRLRWQGTLRLIGTGAAGGTWLGQGFADIGNTVTPFSTMLTWVMPTTKALRTVTCDVTADRAIGIGAAWGTSSASNTITVDEFTVKCTS
jgi:hypothetical protein